MHLALLHLSEKLLPLQFNLLYVLLGFTALPRSRLAAVFPDSPLLRSAAAPTVAGYRIMCLAAKQNGLDPPSPEEYDRFMSGWESKAPELLEALLQP